MSHYDFPKPAISLFVLWQLKVSSVSFKGERNIVDIQKIKIKKQIPDFTYNCYGKTILLNHWNYHWKKLQLHSNDVAPKMQWNRSLRSFQVLTMYHIFRSSGRKWKLKRKILQSNRTKQQHYMVPLTKNKWILKRGKTKMIDTNVMYQSATTIGLK